MLHYRNFEFDSKEDFKDYIEKRIIDFWKSHSDSFSRVCRVCEDEDLESVSYSYSESEVFEQLIDDYSQVFTPQYGCVYYNLFSDVYDIMHHYNEDEIQERMNDDYYEHLFEDDGNFFLLADDDLNDEYKDY